MQSNKSAKIANNEDYVDSMTSINDIEDLMDDDIKGFVYFGRPSCQKCINTEIVLNDILNSEKDLKIYKFDTDYWRDNKYFSDVLEKYHIESVPTFIQIEENGKYRVFNGSEEMSKTREDYEKDLREFLFG